MGRSKLYRNIAIAFCALTIFAAMYGIQNSSQIPEGICIIPALLAMFFSYLAQKKS